MIHKAFLVSVGDLRELCRELKNYSLRVGGGNVTIPPHDSADGLNDISFTFPTISGF